LRLEGTDAPGRHEAEIYINFGINVGLVTMAKDKKKSKGPKDRNSNYQMKNGNAVSKKKEKKPAAAPVKEASSNKVAPSVLPNKAGQSKSLLSGISSSISSATSSISKMFKH